MRDRIIYFIDYGVSKEEIIEIGWALRKFNYVVVPVQPELLIHQLRKSGNRCPIISIIQSRAQHSLYLKFKRRFLFQAIRNMRLLHIEFTSFLEAIDSSDLSLRGRVYRYSLPIQLDELCKIINENCTSFYETSKKWPGGVRAKIPSQGKL